MIKTKISVTIITCMLTLCSCTCCMPDVSEEERNRLTKQEIKTSTK